MNEGRKQTENFRTNSIKNILTDYSQKSLLYLLTLTLPWFKCEAQYALTTTGVNVTCYMK